MTLFPNMLNAVLSMDAYNRGYDVKQGIPNARPVCLDWVLVCDRLAFAEGRGLRI